MKHLDLNLPAPAANLACDEVLLDECEAGGSGEVLRFWESPEVFVVLGYANDPATEVNVPACSERQVPILRRCSGGGAVLQGPGCLNYVLILRVDEAGPLTTVHGTNAFIMGKHRHLFQSLIQNLQPGSLPGLAGALLPSIEVQGDTDLALGQLKFSGNAQRRRRHSVLFHGTFLLGFDLGLLEELLLHPSKEPKYRVRRGHSQFVTNLPMSPAQVKQALRECWGCAGPLTEVPYAGIDRLIQEKYGRQEWNLRRE